MNTSKDKLVLNVLWDKFEIFWLLWYLDIFEDLWYLCMDIVGMVGYSWYYLEWNTFIMKPIVQLIPTWLLISWPFGVWTDNSSKNKELNGVSWRPSGGTPAFLYWGTKVMKFEDGLAMSRRFPWWLATHDLIRGVTLGCELPVQRATYRLISFPPPHVWAL